MNTYPREPVRRFATSRKRSDRSAPRRFAGRPAPPPEQVRADPATAISCRSWPSTDGTRTIAGGRQGGTSAGGRRVPAGGRPGRPAFCCRPEAGQRGAAGLPRLREQSAYRRRPRGQNPSGCSGCCLTAEPDTSGPNGASPRRRSWPSGSSARRSASRSTTLITGICWIRSCGSAPTTGRATRCGGARSRWRSCWPTGSHERSWPAPGN